MFSDAFLNYFTPTERNSEMVRMVAHIGDSTEVGLVTDIQGFLDRTLDFTKLDEKNLRSLLAYLLITVPVLRGSKGTVNIVIDSAQASVIVPLGGRAVSSSGLVFTQENQIVLNQGESGQLRFNQGDDVTVNGLYQQYIQLRVSDLEISTIKLSIAGTEIAMVRKNDLGVVRPYNGFFPYYFNGVLFIKVFAGPDVPTLIQGQQFTVSYRRVDGVAGNISADEMSEFIDPLLDSEGNPVEYHFESAEFDGGAELPNKYEIVDLLAYWFYTKDSITKTSDFTRWYRTQPEVGDAVTYSDQDDYIRTGVFRVTGMVRVALVSKLMSQLEDNTIQVLEDRLYNVRDIGLVEYVTPVVSSFVIVIQYRSVADIEGFRVFAEGVVRNFFNLAFLRNLNLSVFEDLDAVMVTNQVRGNYNPEGLRILPLYYLSVNVEAFSLSIQFTFFQGSIEKASPTYRFTTLVEDPENPEEEIEKVFTYREEFSFDTACNIINEKNDVVGTHDYMTGVVVFPNPAEELALAGVLEVEGLSTKLGVFSAGKLYGYRKLEKIRFEVYD